jgi:hypothetical protein
MGIALVVKKVNFSKVGLGEVTKKESSSTCPCDPNCNCNGQTESYKVKTSSK